MKAESQEMQYQILHVIPRLGNGGIEKLIIDWCQIINKTEYHIDILTAWIDSDQSKRALEALGCRVYEMQLRNRNILKKEKYILSLLHTNNYDAVHLHSSNAADFTTLLWAKKAGVKVRIAHGHTANPNHGSLIKNISHKLCPIFMRHFATNYAGCSNAAAAELVGWKALGSEKYRLIINGINTVAFRYDKEARTAVRSELNLSHNFIIGHVGRMNEQKNHMFLLEVFGECVNIRQDARLMLIGDGELKDEICKEAKQMGLKNKIVFIGVTNEVPRYLSAMDHFLFPSLYEGFGIALLEAQCSGLACTVSSEIVEDAIVLETTKQVSLAKSAKEWAKIVCAERNTINREDAAAIIKKAGYDIGEYNLNEYYSETIRR